MFFICLLFFLKIFSYLIRFKKGDGSDLYMGIVANYVVFTDIKRSSKFKIKKNGGNRYEYHIIFEGDEFALSTNDNGSHRILMHEALDLTNPSQFFTLLFHANGKFKIARNNIGSCIEYDVTGKIFNDKGCVNGKNEQYFIIEPVGVDQEMYNASAVPENLEKYKEIQKKSLECFKKALGYEKQIKGSNVLDRLKDKKVRSEIVEWVPVKGGLGRVPIIRYFESTGRIQHSEKDTLKSVI